MPIYRASVICSRNRRSGAALISRVGFIAIRDTEYTMYISRNGVSYPLLLQRLCYVARPQAHGALCLCLCFAGQLSLDSMHASAPSDTRIGQPVPLLRVSNHLSNIIGVPLKGSDLRQPRRALPGTPRC